MKKGRYVSPLVAGSVKILAACTGQADLENSATAMKLMTVPVNSHASQGEVRAIENAQANLVSTERGAFVHLKTSGLSPGHVHTIWFVAINEPGLCAVPPCEVSDVLAHSAVTMSDVGFADSLIVGSDGVAQFSAYVPVGDLRNAWHGIGYLNALGAEIHLAIADHGPVVRENVENMLSSYRGGCTDESLPADVPESARSDGIPGTNTCRMVQFAVFDQSAQPTAQLN